MTARQIIMGVKPLLDRANNPATPQEERVSCTYDIFKYLNANITSVKEAMNTRFGVIADNKASYLLSKLQKERNARFLTDGEEDLVTEMLQFRGLYHS